MVTKKHHKKEEKWMKKAFAGDDEGAFKRQLGVPKSETIPLTLLEEIRISDIGKIAHNPTKVGKRYIHVTRLLKNRAMAVLNADRSKK